MYLTPATDEVSELSRAWTEVASFGDRVEDTTNSVATIERPIVSAPVDRDAPPLQGEEHHEGRNGDSGGECGGGDAERKQTVKKFG